MKKNFRLFCTMCLAGSLAIFASSCKKSEEKQSVEVTLPAFEEVIGDEGDADKAYIDFYNNSTFHWNGKDHIVVYNICEDDHTKSGKGVFEAQTNAEGQPTGKFWQISGDDMYYKQDHFFILFPEARVKDITAPLGIKNREYFVVPRVQYYSYDNNGNPTVDPNAMALACEAYALTNQVSLNHIFGVCRLRLQGTAVVDSIQFIGNTAPAAIANDGLTGEVTLRLHKVDLQKFSSLMDLYTAANLIDQTSDYFTQWAAYQSELGYAPAENGKELMLKCHNDNTDVHGVQLNPSTYTNFYLSVRPGAFIHGFDVNVYYHVGSTTGVKNINNFIAPNENGTHMKDSYCIKAGKVTGFRPKNTDGSYVTIP